MHSIKTCSKEVIVDYISNFYEVRKDRFAEITEKEVMDIKSGIMSGSYKFSPLRLTSVRNNNSPCDFMSVFKFKGNKGYKEDCFTLVATKEDELVLMALGHMLLLIIHSNYPIRDISKTLHEILNKLSLAGKMQTIEVGDEPVPCFGGNLIYILDNALSGNNNILWSNNDWEILYTFAEWMPITAWEALPFQVVPYRTPLIRSPVQKPGLLNVLGDSYTERIKSFNLKEAIRYSYLKDLRFILCLCAMLGFSIWWIVAPEPLLIKPAALCSPDLSTIFKVVRETFIDQVCCSHPQVASPCDCGEPLNKTAKSIRHGVVTINGKIDRNRISIADLFKHVLITRYVDGNGNIYRKASEEFHSFAPMCLLPCLVPSPYVLSGLAPFCLS
ncbi:hypothetical protein VNO77_47737 [Canavalia gladiata]|uniref:Uncharacterized protein n=1 Tax=Canavalia gladiata TaxID=3824 RepID=A0AAN9PGN8_CANGL